MNNTCQIPKKFTVGDTLSWEENWSDYPATIYTLTLVLISESGKNVFTATSDGDSHKFTVDASGLTAGRYDFQLKAIGDGFRSAIDRGFVTVLADLAVADNFDGRDWLDKSIEALEASIEGRASYVQLRQEFDGRSVENMSQLDQMDLLDRFYKKRAARKRGQRVKKGLSPFRQIKAGFTR